MPSITILELEAIINRCAKQHPPIDYVLGPDMRTLAEVYGEMIYRHLSALELAGLPPKCREVFERWYQPKEARACPLDGKGDCDACQ